MNYLELLTTDLLDIIDSNINNYEDHTNFINILNTFINTDIINISREFRYKNVFKKEFTVFYDLFDNYMNNKKDKKWEIIYNMMDQNIPKIIPEAYVDPNDEDYESDINENDEVDNEDNMILDTNRNPVYSYKNIPRSKLNTTYIFNSIGIIKFPPILYEVMFYNKYVCNRVDISGVSISEEMDTTKYNDVYKKISRYMQNIDDSYDLWYGLYVIFKSVLDDGTDWTILTDYDFYEEFFKALSKNPHNTKIYRNIMYTNDAVREILGDQFIDFNVEYLIVLPGDPNYDNIMIFFKFIFEEYCDMDPDIVQDYIDVFKNNNDLKMVEWLNEKINN